MKKVFGLMFSFLVLFISGCLTASGGKMWDPAGLPRFAYNNGGGMMCEGIILIKVMVVLFLLGFGYLIFAYATKQHAGIKTFGRLVGLVIIVFALFSILTALIAMAVMARNCPMKQKCMGMNKGMKQYHIEMREKIPMMKERM